jgi:hypothetical protein
MEEKAMLCEVGKELQKHEDLSRGYANAAFASDRNSLIGLAHAQAATDYYRVLDMHIRNGCEECGLSQRRIARL